MTQLPRGWVEVEVAEIAQVIRGVTYSKPEATASPGTDRIALLRATNIGRELSLEDVYYVPSSRVTEAQHLRPGDVVVATSSGSLSVVGKSARLRHAWEGTFGAFCSVLRSDPELSEAYLSYAVASPDVRQEWSELARGSNINNLRSGHLTQTRIPLAPRAEQERIVAAIEEAFSLLDAGEAGLHATRTLLKRMRHSVLAAAVTGQLVPQNPTDTPAAQELSAVGVEPIVVPDATVLPSTWAWATLGDMSAIGGGIQKQPKRRPASNPVPFLRVANVGRGSLDLDDVHQIEVFPGELERYGLEFGDLLVVEGNGSPDQIGRAAVWQAAIQPCVHQNHLIRVRPLHALSPSYLGLFWNSPEASARVQAVSSSTSGLHTLSTGKLRRLPVAVPPVEEQARIVAEAERQFSFIEAAERAVEAALLRAVGLRRSVLKAAFEGQLVPQDPADEPASVLLERIAAEPAAAPSGTGPRASSIDRASGVGLRTEGKWRPGLH